MKPKEKTQAAAAASGAAALAYIWYYFAKAVKAPHLYFKDGPFARLVQTHCTTLLQPFLPTPWAFNGHTQTMLGVARQFWRTGGYRRQCLVTPDGGLIALDWFCCCDTDSSIDEAVPILMVFHGLTGGSREGYCKGICAAAQIKGWRAVVLNYRGCAGLPLTSGKCYSAAFTDDVHLGIEEVQRRFPKAPLFAAGYSLGALILTKYLAEADTGKWPGEGSGISCAAMVSSPFCLHTARVNLSRPWTMARVYNGLLAFRLRQYYKQHEHFLSSHAPYDALTEALTIGHFDRAIVCRVFGYTDVEQYYIDGSSEGYVPLIRTPTLYLASQDDPFVGRLPIPECSANPNTVLAVTSRGGHVAFLQGLWPFGHSWMDKTVTEFFEVCLRHKGELPPREVAPQRARL